MRLSGKRSPLVLLATLLVTAAFSAPASASFDAPGPGIDVPNGYPGAGRPAGVEPGTAAGRLAAQPAAVPRP